MQLKSEKSLADADQWQQLISETPALKSMGKLFQKLDDVLFCLKDTQGRYLWANDAFLRQVRVDSINEITGRTAAEIFPSLLAISYEKQDVHLIERGRETHDRLEMITNPDGSYGWFLSDKVLVRGKRDQILAIASMSRDLHAHAERDQRFGRLEKVVRQMRERYSEPLKISVLAAESGFTTSSLERLLRSVYKLSPKQALTRIRIEAAADLLRETDNTIASIALDCGFCDHAALCRSFRAITGTTALQYRKLSREQAAAHYP